MTELEKVIANLGYPVGMGVAPSPADLARMKDAIIADKYREGYDNALAEQSFDRAELKAEIERLRARNKEHEARYEALEALGLRHDRAAIIEECARVVEAECRDYDSMLEVAAAIRALKEKP